MHQVKAGDSLIAIAKKHGTTVSALCKANGLRRDQIIRIGQKLVLPTPENRAPAASKSAPRAQVGAQAPPSSAKREALASLSTAPKPAPTGAAPSWAPYSKRPAKRGYLELESTVGRFSGQAMLGHWEIPESTRIGISRVFASWRTGEEERIHGRLIRLLVRVSDQFGGRKIRIVSGYRGRHPHQHTRHSKHNLGRAVDFSIPGVPNEVIRDYLRHTFNNVGVGYYPNSTHVHLDIRDGNAYWVDYSRPGQPPRYGSPDSAAGEAKSAHVGSKQNAPPGHSAARETSAAPAQTESAESNQEPSHAELEGAQNKIPASSDVPVVRGAAG